MTESATLRNALCALLAAGAAVAPSGASSSPPTPVEATLTIRLPAGKATYAIGELIPLELEFRGRADPDFYFSTATYDRSGRMGQERYTITPVGGSDDPLVEYFSSVGIFGGGVSGWHALDGTPLVVRVHLNEWIRFTKPGDYRLVVESSRLERYSRRGAPTVVSNPVTLHIQKPTPGWAADEVARAVAALESGRPDGLREGAAILRHLGTLDAALALVSHYGAGGGELRFDWLAGLVASPHRSEVVKAMEARVDAGEPLPPGLFRDLSLLHSLLDHPAGTGRALERFEDQKTAECDYTRRSLEGLGRRSLSAAALRAVLAAQAEPPDPACESSLASLLAADPAPAREAFLELPRPTQALLLEYRWNAIAGPWIQPVLEAVYAGWRGDSRVAGAGDQALRRLAEVDPPRGRALALEEIRTGARGVAPDTLLSLVDEPLPGLDDVLRERYQATPSYERKAASMWLVARYGSASLAPFVRGELERGPACDLEAAAIAYLLEHDPPTALGRLQPDFDRSRPRMCVVPPWGLLAPRHWDDSVEDAAIAHLRASDVRLAFDAVQILGTYGSARVKVPLLERFVRWEAAWHGREKELDGPPTPDSPAILENALVNALFENPRVVLTAADGRRIRGLCVTEACRQDVDARLARNRARSVRP